MLVNTKTMLLAAQHGSYAVAQFNLNGFEWIKCLLALAEQKNIPIILGVSEKAAEYMCGYETTAAMVREAYKAMHITVPVALHADHSHYDSACAAIEAGFTSVMCDGSSEPLEINLKCTEEIVKIAHARGITVEAEMGAVAGKEDGISSEGELASPADCRRLAECGIDTLAAGIGNVHGAYPTDWSGLDFERLALIRESVPELPLALHGGSGIPDDMIRRAIVGGVAKINVNSECKDSFCSGIAAHMKSKETAVSPFSLYKAGIDGIAKIAEAKLKLFGFDQRTTTDSAFVPQYFDYSRLGYEKQDCNE